MAGENREDVLITGNIEGLRAAMVGAQATVKEGTAGIAESFEAMGGIIDAALAPLTAFFALFETFEFIGNAVDAAVEFGEQVRIMGIKTGMSAEDVSALEFAANMADVSIDSLRVGMQRLARAMEETHNSASPVNAVFEALNVRATDANGSLRPMRDVLTDLADRFSHMQDGAGKTALAMQLFGRSGSDLIPLLNEGSKGIEELERKAKELGVTIGEDDVAAMHAFEDKSKELTAQWAAMKRALGENSTPFLQTLKEWSLDVAHALGEAADDVWRMATGFSFIAAMKSKRAFDNLFAQAQRPTEPPKKPAPTIADPSTLPSEMERWAEELNVLKEKGLQNKDDLVALEIIFWQSKLELAQKGSKEYIAIHTKIVELESEDQRKRDAAEKKSVEETIKLQHQWEKTLESVPKTFTDAIGAMKGTAGTFRDFMRELWYDLVAMSAKAAWDMVADHFAAELAKRGISKEAAAERVAVESATAIKVVAIKIWEGLRWIAIEAAKAGAGAWAALADIPIVGPALGLAAAAATIAGVLALSKTFSAMNGFDVPSNMNPMTQLHAEEMVLPKEYANVIRGMANGGGSGGGDTHQWYISTMDAGSFEQFAMRHGGIIYKAAFAGGTKGKHLPGTPGRSPG